jgi:hypothetical protein
MSLPPQADISQQLTMASAAWTKLRKLAAYASFDGWSLILLGALSLVCFGHGSVIDLLLSFALLGTGLFELSSVRQLRRLKPSAITHLAYNQLVLAAALILYSIVSLVQSHGSGGGISLELDQALAQIGASSSDAKDQLSAAVEILCTALMAFALLVQGGTALYYFSRRKHLQRYLEQTPDWIQQMQRERGEVSI